LPKALWKKFTKTKINSAYLFSRDVNIVNVKNVSLLMIEEYKKHKIILKGETEFLERWQKK